MMKKILSLALFLALCFTVTAAASAITPEKLEEATRYADELHELGLFKGTNNGYDLDKPANRAQGITMLVRLLGKERLAKGCAIFIDSPYHDLDPWMETYVNYAYQVDLTRGVSRDEFAPKRAVNARMYLTFALRALGYGKDDGLTWENTYDFAAQKGLIAAGEYTDESEFLRADMVILSRRALDLNEKTTGKPLLETATGPDGCLVDDSGFINTGGQPIGSLADIGYFDAMFVPEEDPFGDPNKTYIRPTFDGTETLWEAEAELQEFVRHKYHTFFWENGVGQMHQTASCLILVEDDQDRLGAFIYAWRNDRGRERYANDKLQAALETFYYLSGDRYVAYALWNWIDVASLLGTANSDDFGFTDVGDFIDGERGTITMNGVTIECVFNQPGGPYGDKIGTYYWFERPQNR